MLKHLTSVFTSWAAFAVSPRTLGVPEEVFRARHVPMLHLEDGARTPILASGLCMFVRSQHGINGTVLFRSGPGNAIANGALATMVPFALHRPSRQIFSDALVRLDFREQLGRTPIFTL